MKAHTKEAFDILAVAFPRWEASFQKPERIETWGDLLADVPRDRLIRAANDLAKSSRFPPSISEIRDAAGCIDPGKVAVRSASAEALARHWAWIERRIQLANERARQGLLRDGKDPDAIEPVAISELTKGIGR